MTSKTVNDDFTSLTVSLKGGAMHTLHFNTLAGALSALADMRGARNNAAVFVCTIKDDYCGELDVETREVASAHVVSIAEELAAQEEAGLLKALAQHSLNDRASNHPKLKIRRAAPGSVVLRQ